MSGAQVTWTEPLEDGIGWQSMVVTSEPLALGPVEVSPATVEPRTILGRFVAAGDLIQVGDKHLLVRSVRSITYPVVKHGRSERVESIEATLAGRELHLIDPYEQVPVVTRDCEDCHRVWITTARQWPDRNQCPACAGVLDPNEGPF